MADAPLESNDNDEEHPTIDLSSALGEAGHEVEDLGATDAPDDAPLVRTSEDIATDEERESERDLAIDRAQFGAPRLPRE